MHLPQILLRGIWGKGKPVPPLPSAFHLLITSLFRGARFKKKLRNASPIIAYMMEEEKYEGWSPGGDDPGGEPGAGRLSI